MKKILFFVLFSFSTLSAGLINAIALTVNNEPITLVDIDNKMSSSNMNKEQATQVLIDEILYAQLIKKQNIFIDIFDVNNYVEQLASQNKMKVYEFKNAVKQQENYKDFENKIKKQLKHQKLIASIASGKISKASDDDLEIYYNNNLHEFNSPSKIDLKAYISLDKRALLSVRKNPMMLNNNVKIEDLSVNTSELNSKIKYIISKTKQNTFSSIFVNNKAYNMLYVVKKYDIQTISFEEAKNKIFEIIMKQRQDDYLRNYFETLKQTANIKVLR